MISSHTFSPGLQSYRISLKLALFVVHSWASFPALLLYSIVLCTSLRLHETHNYVSHINTMSTVATQRNCQSFLQCAVIITASCYEWLHYTMNTRTAKIIIRRLSLTVVKGTVCKALLCLQEDWQQQSDCKLHDAHIIKLHCHTAKTPLTYPVRSFSADQCNSIPRTCCVWRFVLWL